MKATRRLRFFARVAYQETHWRAVVDCLDGIGQPADAPQFVRGYHARPVCVCEGDVRP